MRWKNQPKFASNNSSKFASNNSSKFALNNFPKFASNDFFGMILWAVTRLLISFGQARGSGPNELDHSYEMEEDNIDDDTVDVSPSVQRGSLCEPVGRAESGPFCVLIDFSQ